MRRQRKDNLTSTIITSLRTRRASRPAEKVAVETGQLRVASYNVHKCVGTDGRFDPERILKVIGEIDPDVIALQEADTRFGERTGLLDLKRLQVETGLTAVPITGLARAHGWHGNALFVRRAIIRDIHQMNLPGIEPRGALVTEVELETGSALRFIAAHFGLLRWARLRQVDAIAALMRNGPDIATVLMGDFNEWRLGERSALSALQADFGPLPQPVPSFPSRLPMLSLDRILGNRQGLVQGLAVHDSALSRIASDHLPLTGIVNLDRAGGNGPVANG